MNVYIDLIVDKWLREYADCKKADPFPIWEYCNNEIIGKMPEQVSDTSIGQARFINNALYWGRMELNKYV